MQIYISDAIGLVLFRGNVRCLLQINICCGVVLLDKIDGGATICGTGHLNPTLFSDIRLCSLGWDMFAAEPGI